MTGPRRCLQVDRNATREDLVARGVTPEAADELLAMRDRLLGKRRRIMGELEPDDGAYMEAHVPPEALQDNEGVGGPPSRPENRG